MAKIYNASGKGDSSELQPMSPKEAAAELDRERRVKQRSSKEQRSIGKPPKAPQLQSNSISGNTKLPKRRRSVPGKPPEDALSDGSGGVTKNPQKGRPGSKRESKARGFKSPWTIAILGFILAFGMAFGVQQWRGSLLGADGYYHVRVAKLYAEGKLQVAPEALKEFGIAIDVPEDGNEFPWMRHSIMRDNFSDKDYLFHLMLVPFVQLVDDTPEELEFAGVLGAATGAGIVGFVLAFVLAATGVPLPIFWFIAGITASETIVYRMSLCRSFLLSVAIAILAYWLISKRRWWWLIPLGAVYALSYTAPHLLVAMALLWGAFEFFAPAPERRGIFKRGFGLILPVAASCLGIAIGVALHPQWQNIVELWFAQSVAVPLTSAGFPELVGDMTERLAVPFDADTDIKVKDFGMELNPSSGNTLVTVQFWGLLAMIVPWLLISAARVKVSRSAFFAYICALAFFTAFLMAERFSEYFFPFAFLSAALLVRDVVASDAWGDWRKAMPKRITAVIVIVVVACLANAALRPWNLNRFLIKEHEVSIHGQNKVVPERPQRFFKDAAMAIREHVEPGGQVFHADWGAFPQLFFFAPDYGYVVGLDPMFLYLHDPELYQRYTEINNLGRQTFAMQPPLPLEIQERFGANYILVRYEQSGLALECQRYVNSDRGRSAGARLVASAEDRAWELYAIHAKSP